MFAVNDYTACSTLFLSLPFSEGFTPFQHSSSGETCFSKLFFEPLKNFRWLESFCSEKFENTLCPGMGTQPTKNLLGKGNKTVAKTLEKSIEANGDYFEEKHVKEVSFR